MALSQEEIDENLLFKKRWVLNFDNIDWDTPIYRVYPIDRLTQLFTDKKTL
jgi:hypothetical protein